MATIDTCIHHRWAQDEELDRYLPEDWLRYIDRPEPPLRGAGRKILPGIRYSNPSGDDLVSARPEAGPPGSDPPMLVDQALEAGDVSRALLLFDRAMFAPAIPNHFLATQVVRAINDWNVDRWLSRDERLYGAVLVPVQMPAEAAAEIRRAGQHRKIAGVLMAAGIGKLFGHPLYYPIYEAAQELDLPIILHRGIDAISETEMSSGPAGGPPMTFAEYHALAPLALTSQVMSMITDGVFARYPDLRVCVVGAGITWLPGWLRRMDLLYQAERREVPWMRKTPSEYVRDHVRVSTYGLELPPRGKLTQFLTDHPDLREIYCYGSGYPSWDTTSAAEVMKALPEDWRAAVLKDNADAWFRWPAGAGSAPHETEMAAGA